MLENNIKASNPKDAIGVKKVGLSVLPVRVLLHVALAFLEGALKYGRSNYRAIGVRTSVYFDAVQRHLFAWWEGQDIDPDSGRHHIDKAIACLMILRDSQLIGNCTDDRPPSHKDDWQNELNQGAANLIDKYPSPKEAYVKQ